MAKQSNDPAASPKAGGGASDDRPGDGDGASDEQNGKTQATLGDLQALETRIKQGLATQYQGVQSLIDRQSVSLKAKLDPVNNLIASLREQGVEISDSQAELERNKALTDALTGTGDEEPEAEPLPNPQQQEPSGMGKLALDMMRTRGVVILQDDVELALIDQQTQDPKVFMDSIDAAITAKVERLADPEAALSDETETEPSGPGVNPRGKGAKKGTILPEETPSGSRTTSQDFLQAGYQESDDFPAPAE